MGENKANRTTGRTEAAQSVFFIVSLIPPVHDLSQVVSVAHEYGLPQVAFRSLRDRLIHRPLNVNSRSTNKIYPKPLHTKKTLFRSEQHFSKPLHTGKLLETVLDSPDTTQLQILSTNS